MSSLPKAMWSQSAVVCAIANTHGQLGLAIKTEAGWTAYTRPNLDIAESGFTKLGNFLNRADAKTAIEDGLGFTSLDPARYSRKRIKTTCLVCRSTQVKTKRATGFDWLKILLTGKRKYSCMNCGCCFRAPDRRSSDRNVSRQAVTHPSGIWH